MSGKWAAIAVLAVIGAIGVPVFVAKNLQLGGHAKSPQEAKISLGSSVVVAGGRAKIWFAGGNTGGDFEISCRTESKFVSPELGSEGTVYRACGVGVELKEIEEPKGRPTRAIFEITWKNDAP